MKIAFISDIHGNAIALEAVIENINKRKVDKICVLGDICFRGPEPKRSLELVQTLNADVIKGNADEWVVRGIQKGEVADQALEIMQKEREWIYSRLDKEDIQYLKELPIDLKLSYGGLKIHAFHATPASLFDIVQSNNEEEIARVLMAEEADIYVYGHIHKAYIKYINGKCIVNLGSVGLPFDGLSKASYALIDTDGSSFQSSIIRVAYDIEKVIGQWRKTDYPNIDMMINIIQKGRP
jgi:putative phosphoesterase